jgi:ankyrin repeat protein
MTALNDKGMTALHLAARGQPIVTQDMSDQYRSTPDQAAIIKLLLAKGADRTIRDAKGRTARDLAEMNQQKDALALLEESK